jgi:ribonuclease HI
MEQKNRCLTINTDASFHPQLKLGGFAFYIKCDQFKIQAGGMFKKRFLNSKEAEMAAIGNALATVLAQKELPTNINWLIINCDCIPAMDEIKQKKSLMGSEINKLFKQLSKRLKSKNNAFRHVKAHNHAPDARSWVNEWCDSEAKRFMRENVAKTINQD